MLHATGNNSYLDVYEDGGGFNETLQNATLGYADVHGRNAILWAMSDMTSHLKFVLSIAAVLCNALVLGVFCHVTDSLTNHFCLVISLCVSDLLIGVTHFMDLCLVEVMMNEMQRQCLFMFNVNFYMGMFVCSILNITLMAGDHYMAIQYHMRYEILVTRGRIVTCVAIAWIVSMTIGSIRVWPALSTYVTGNASFCEAMLMDDFRISAWWAYSFVYVVAGVGLAIMVYTYVSIYRVSTGILRRSSGTLQGDYSAKYRATVTTLWILGTFTVLWFPTLIFNVILYMNNGEPDPHLYDTMYEFLACLPLLNAVCDPIIYAIRLRVVRKQLTCACCVQRPEQPATEMFSL